MDWLGRHVIGASIEMRRCLEIPGKGCAEEVM